MSDEGMSDAHLKALAGLYKDADDSGMESKWEAIGNALCNAYPLIIDRLDAAERERDALREALSEIVASDSPLGRNGVPSHKEIARRALKGIDHE